MRSWRERLKGGQIAAANNEHRRSYTAGYAAALKAVKREIEMQTSRFLFSKAILARIARLEKDASP